MKIIFATNNHNKLAEIRDALGGKFELLSLSDIDSEGEIPETGRTLGANAMQKATYIFERFRQPVFADDTGLEVNCLNKEPGVDTAHYSGSRNSERNMEKLLSEMQNCTDRSAQFRTIFAFVTAERKEMFEGKVEGRIAAAKRGNDGFGYDPVFIPEEADRTFGEMNREEKAKSNHRVRALEAFTDFLKKTF